MNDGDNNKNNNNLKRLKKRKRIIGTVSLIIAAALFVGLSALITWVLFKKIEPLESLESQNRYEAFRDYILSFGWKSRLVFISIQVLQIVIALIPGEIVEVGAGLTFGALEGTLLCMGGIAAASAVIFAFAKRWGIRFVELFISAEKIN